jgi:hypothetical protein
MFADPPAEPPAAYVQSLGMDSWINCERGFPELEKTLKAGGGGKSVKLFESKLAFTAYKGGYLVTKPGNPLHPAILMQAFKDPTADSLQLVYGGCGYGDRTAFGQFLTSRGWEAEEVTMRPVTGLPRADGRPEVQYVPNGEWASFGAFTE